MLSANFRSKQLFIGVLACSFTITTPTFPTLTLEIGERVDDQILQKSLSAINWRNLAKIIIRKPPKPVTIPTIKPTLPSTRTIPKPPVPKTTRTKPTPTPTGKSPKPPRRKRNSNDNTQSSGSNTDTQYLGTLCRGNDKNYYLYTTNFEWLYFKNSEFVKIDNPSFNLLCDTDVIQSSSNKFDFPCSSTSYIYYRDERSFYPTSTLVPGVGCTNG
jgi:hypothetical protein